MCAAATRAWYLPMWVSSARPLTSPIAYSHSCSIARMLSSHLDRLARLQPQRLQAELARVGAPPDRDQQLLPLQRAPVCQLQGHHARRHVRTHARAHARTVLAPSGRGRNAEHDLHALRLQRGAHLLGGERLLVRDQPLQPTRRSSHGRRARRTRRPSPRPPRRRRGSESDAGICTCGRYLAVGPRRALAQPGDRRDRRARTGCEHDRAPGAQHLRRRPAPRARR